MKEIKVTLPEDQREIFEEVTKNLFHATSMMLLFVDKLIDVLRSSESVAPNFHL